MKKLKEQPQTSESEPTPELEKPKIERPFISPTGFFPGFNIKYPEYEVVTPHTNVSYTVRSLTVSEEEAMKGSLLTPRKIPEHLNDIIWESMVKRPDEIQSKVDYLNKTTLKDRDALMYGLFHITYKDDHNYDVGCPACNNTYPVKIKISSTFSSKPYPGEKYSILEKRVPVELPSVEGVVAIVKQPTIKDETAMLENSMFQSDKNIDVGIQMLVIDKFIFTDPETDEKTEITGVEGIHSGYIGLPSHDRKKINETYIENFGNFGISLIMESTCTSCSHTHDTNIDLVQQFFRAMYQ